MLPSKKEMGHLKGTCTGIEWFIYIILYGNNAEMGFKGNLSPHFCHCGVIMFVWRIPSSMGYDKRCISTYPIIIYSMWKYEVCTLFNRKGFAIGGYICMSIYNTYLQEIAVKLLLYLSIQCPVIYGKICFLY